MLFILKSLIIKCKNMPGNLEVFKKSNEKNFFIETGCYIGDGIADAISAGYKNIIEIAEHYQRVCLERFKNNQNVNIIIGDSSEILYDTIKDIDSPITFWLDGHFSGANTGMGKYEFPLIQELDQIARHSIKTHTIMIDDMRLFQDKKYGFDKNMIIEKILEINKEYKISYEDGYQEKDILIASV